MRSKMKMEEIKKIAVIGAGTMGPGIALMFGWHGYAVRLFSLNTEESEKAGSVMRTSLEILLECEILTKDEIEPTLGRVSMTNSMQKAGQDADFICEAVVEMKDVKRAVFEQLDHICPSKTIFASNTSSLNIFDLVPKDRLSRTLIAHWFAPPHIVPIVEVVQGPDTTNETIELTCSLLEGVGRTPIRMKKFVPGFVINRLYRALGREIFFLLDNGYITADQLDLAGKLALGARMMILGLVQRYDFTGLDISARNLENPDFFDPPIDNRPKSLFDLVQKGHLGVKTGKGFFDYSDKKLEEILKKRDSDLLKIYKNIAFSNEGG
jgi:3-hydroxybutyryl-CoA dehydrogenase